jgi:hypothetical protein
MKFLRYVAWFVMFILFSFTKCAPVQITVTDSIQPYITNQIDILKIDTIITPYGHDKMYKIYYRYSNR